MRLGLAWKCEGGVLWMFKWVLMSFTDFSADEGLHHDNSYYITNTSSSMYFVR